MSSPRDLQVLLHDRPVGQLSFRNDGCEFRLLESYKHAYPRPVLGQLFLDDMEHVQHSRARLPPWFSNLLPEGPLRDFVAKQAGVIASREFFLLHHLGEDLPGAVRIIADAMLSGEGEETTVAPHQQAEPGPWHFSLAGVQLKFSARRGERGLTIPVTGQGGDWIIKLPDARYPNVPENEYATMHWAAASGIRIPTVELVDVADITGLPASVGEFAERRALAVRRFDRSASGQRVHMEDFAQVLGLYPEEKYDKYNYETLARVAFALTGETGLGELILRLVFIVLSGNGDAHFKNWSLLYPDGVRAELSPAYDLVSTIQYMPADRLALNLAKSKNWDAIGMEAFRRMARKIGEEESRMVDRVQAALDAIMAAWHVSGGEFGYDSRARGLIERHIHSIPLLK